MEHEHDLGRAGDLSSEGLSNHISGKKTCPSQCAGQDSKRKARRVEYARIQREWQKSPTKCLRVILKSKSEGTPPAKLEITQFWQTVMTEERTRSSPIELARQAMNDLWAHVTAEKVKTFSPVLSTCPGPDSLTSRQFRAVPIPILVNMFNQFLMVGKLPK